VSRLASGTWVRKTARIIVPERAVMADEMLVRSAGGARVISLNRPHKHNAFDDEMYEALCEATRAAVTDVGVRAIVLRGEGKSFSSRRDTTVLGRHGNDGDFALIDHALADRGFDRRAAAGGRGLASHAGRKAEPAVSYEPNTRPTLAEFADEVTEFLTEHAAPVTGCGDDASPGAGGDYGTAIFADIDPAADQRLLGEARACRAEQVGGAQRTAEMAVEYARRRTQFGRPIGSLQAIRDKCVDVFMQVESARFAATEGVRAVAGDWPDLPALASLAKACCSDAYCVAASETSRSTAASVSPGSSRRTCITAARCQASSCSARPTAIANCSHRPSACDPAGREESI
jgi:hypothetical protein